MPFRAGSTEPVQNSFAPRRRSARDARSRSRARSPPTVRPALARSPDGKRVARRVETLKRLHHLSARLSHDGHEGDPRPVERGDRSLHPRGTVVFMIHTPTRTASTGVWPGWNLSEEIANGCGFRPTPVRSPHGVSRAGRCTTRTTSARSVQQRGVHKLFGTRNALFAPPRPKRDVRGVVAVNRPAASGRGGRRDDVLRRRRVAAAEERPPLRDADRDGRELPRASRLRTIPPERQPRVADPAHCDVGWTDLLSEENLDEKTLSRGSRPCAPVRRVLLALIDDLLDLARHGSRQPLPRPASGAMPTSFSARSTRFG